MAESAFTQALSLVDYLKNVYKEKYQPPDRLELPQSLAAKMIRLYTVSDEEHFEYGFQLDGNRTTWEISTGEAVSNKQRDSVNARPADNPGTTFGDAHGHPTTFFGYTSSERMGGGFPPIRHKISPIWSAPWKPDRASSSSWPAASGSTPWSRSGASRARALRIGSIQAEVRHRFGSRQEAAEVRDRCLRKVCGGARVRLLCDSHPGRHSHPNGDYTPYPAGRGT